MLGKLDQGDNFHMTKSRGLCVGIALLLLFLAAQASAQSVTLTTNLNGGAETPPLNTGAVGTAEVTIDVPNRELVVTLTVFNIATPTTAAHIHIGPKEVAGPVVIDFPASITGRTGDFVLHFRVSEEAFRARPAIGIHTMDDAIQAIAGGNSYVNIHTTQYPGGEIRGQLNRP
jgi:hypothetical protein